LKSLSTVAPHSHFITFLLPILCCLPQYEQVQERQKTYQEYQKQNQIQSFVQKTAPELFTKISSINKMLAQADNEINRLTEIKNKYPRQA